MQFLIGFLLFYFWVLRRSSSSFYRWRTLLRDIAAHHGGNVYRGYSRRLIYVPPDQNLEVEIKRIWTNRLTIRIRKSFPFFLIFYRLPRLLYAFLEAFIEPSRRIENKPYLVFGSSTAEISDLKKRPGFMALFEKLSAAGFSLQIGNSGLKMWKSLRRADLSETVFQDSLRLAQEFAQVCGGDFVEIPVQPIPSEERCAYCKEMLEENAPVTYCADCGTPHHSECFELNGKCSVFGCESSQTTKTGQEPIRV